MLHLAAHIAEAAAAIRARWDRTPQVGIILGTGLGGVAREIVADAVIEYEAIPHFPRSTAISHAGRLVCGTLAGVRVVAMEGRFHAYEGYTFQQLTFPVRVMKALGADTLIVSNACGGMNPHYRRGDIMVIDDHIICSGQSADRRQRRRARAALSRHVVPLRPATDRACPGDRAAREFYRPSGCLCRGERAESGNRAEYRFLRTIGADVVGMSTVPEVIVAVHSGMRSLGLSIITDMCFPDSLEPAEIDQILAAAASAEPKLRAIVLGVLAKIAAEG